MNKKSKVTSVQSNGTWEGNYGLMYRYEIVFENGDCGEYSSKSQDQNKFVIGKEVEYNFTGGKFPKIKPVYNEMPNNYQSNNKEDLIIKQTCIKAAAEMTENPESAILMAEKFYNWIKGQKMPKRETTDLPF